MPDESGVRCGGKGSRRSARISLSSSRTLLPQCPTLFAYVVVIVNRSVYLILFASIVAVVKWSVNGYYYVFCLTTTLLFGVVCVTGVSTSEDRCTLNGCSTFLYSRC